MTEYITITPSPEVLATLRAAMGETRPQYECPACGHVWASDDAQPSCPMCPDPEPDDGP